MSNGSPEHEDEILDASPKQIIAVIEKMPDLPWPQGEEWLEWKIAGIEGHTNFLCHIVPLAATTDGRGVEDFLRPLRKRADKRWRLRHHFDAARFTDDKDTDPRLYDRRSAPAGMIRSLGAKEATWWALGTDAVVLFNGFDPTDRLHKAAVMVIAQDWLTVGRGPEEEALEAARSAEGDGSLLSDFLSGDQSRILSSVWAVIATRDPEVLAPLAKRRLVIYRSANNIELGGALASNEKNFEHALLRLELFDSSKCLCAAYPAFQFYEPEKEETRGHARRLGTLPNDGQWHPDEIVLCRDCGTLFRVERGEYHYPWWKWTRLATVPESLLPE
ncbi:hypothetical protein BJ980_001609 [Nocardioides daedukensis]|uniref:Uncharacterized protein n=1 Tax=Nocardioides daedukensis TaxID=634462 RepID=A0A7Y9RXV9_9ACTN|nr:hypothetical protein [Nocardioides daedukensis]NYG58686.1 hypothetical protein [Nocardioides daedukensis]